MENKEITVSTEVVTRPDYATEIAAIIRGNDSPKTMTNKLEDYHANDIAEVMTELTQPERKKLYRVCSLDMLAEIFEYLDEDVAGEYLNETDIKKAAAVISKLDTDTAVDILRSIDKEKRTLIIDTVDPDVQKEIRLIASFDEDEIGSRMTVNCIIIREDMTVKQAMNELVRQAEDNDNITTLFVVDENNEFYGAIDLKDLITARSGTALDDIIATSFPYVYATEQTADCIEKLKDYSESLVPVLDDGNRLLGVITSQNIIEASDEEMGEDYARLAGLTAEEDLNEPLGKSMKKRLPWLLILLGLGILVSTVVGAFERVVAQLTLIMAFQSLILAMVISSAVGTLIPLFFKKIGVDPAVASGPLITTVNDLVAVVAYYGMSWLLLLNILHLG